MPFAMPKHIETIVRGVCVAEGQILLCQNRKAEICYLPGGHIDFGEPAARALEREILEEMGLPSRAGRFLGAAEHRFVQQGKPKAEINLVFALDIPGLNPEAGPPPSAEAWIRFFWHPLADLAAVRLEPASLIPALARWLDHGPGWVGMEDAAAP